MLSSSSNLILLKALLIHLLPKISMQSLSKSKVNVISKEGFIAKLFKLDSSLINKAL